MDTIVTNKITCSKEDYLRTIFALSKISRSIRSSDIADKLGITRASVSRMMAVFKESGYIEKEKYGSVILTESGYDIATHIQNRHDLIKAFLIDVLGVTPVIAGKDACRMEHTISPETTEKLNNQFSKLSNCNKSK